MAEYALSLAAAAEQSMRTPAYTAWALPEATFKVDAEQGPHRIPAGTYRIRRVEDDGWCMYRAWVYAHLEDDAFNNSESILFNYKSITPMNLWRIACGMVVKMKEAGYKFDQDMVPIYSRDGTQVGEGWITQEGFDPAKDAFYAERGGNRFLAVQDMAYGLTTLRQKGNINGGPLLWPTSDMLRFLDMLLTNSISMTYTSPQPLILDCAGQRGTDGILCSVNPSQELTATSFTPTDVVPNTFLLHSGGNHYEVIYSEDNLMREQNPKVAPYSINMIVDDIALRKYPGFTREYLSQAEINAEVAQRRPVSAAAVAPLQPVTTSDIDLLARAAQSLLAGAQALMSAAPIGPNFNELARELAALPDIGMPDEELLAAITALPNAEAPAPAPLDVSTMKRDIRAFTDDSREKKRLIDIVYKTLSDADKAQLAAEYATAAAEARKIESITSGLAPASEAGVSVLYGQAVSVFNTLQGILAAMMKRYIPDVGPAVPSAAGGGGQLPTKPIYTGWKDKLLVDADISLAAALAAGNTVPTGSEARGDIDGLINIIRLDKTLIESATDVRSAYDALKLAKSHSNLALAIASAVSKGARTKLEAARTSIAEKDTIELVKRTLRQVNDKAQLSLERIETLNGQLQPLLTSANTNNADVRRLYAEAASNADLVRDILAANDIGASGDLAQLKQALQRAMAATHVVEMSEKGLRAIKIRLDAAAAAAAAAKARVAADTASLGQAEAAAATALAAALTAIRVEANQASEEARQAGIRTDAIAQEHRQNQSVMDAVAVVQERARVAAAEAARAVAATTIADALEAKNAAVAAAREATARAIEAAQAASRAPAAPIVPPAASGGAPAAPIVLPAASGGAPAAPIIPPAASGGAPAAPIVPPAASGGAPAAPIVPPAASGGAPAARNSPLGALGRMVRAATQPPRMPPPSREPGQERPLPPAIGDQLQRLTAPLPSPSPIEGVAGIFVLDPAGKLLIHQRGADGSYAGKLGIPMGSVPPGMTHVQQAIAELQEEAQVAPSPIAGDLKLFYTTMLDSKLGKFYIWQPSASITVSGPAVGHEAEIVRPFPEVAIPETTTTDTVKAAGYAWAPPTALKSFLESAEGRVYKSDFLVAALAAIPAFLQTRQPVVVPAATTAASGDIPAWAAGYISNEVHSRIISDCSGEGEFIGPTCAGKAVLRDVFVAEEFKNKDRLGARPNRGLLKYNELVSEIAALRESGADPAALERKEFQLAQDYGDIPLRLQMPDGTYKVLPLPNPYRALAYREGTVSFANPSGTMDTNDPGHVMRTKNLDVLESLVGPEGKEMLVDSKFATALLEALWFCGQGHVMNDKARCFPALVLAELREMQAAQQQRSVAEIAADLKWTLVQQWAQQIVDQFKGLRAAEAAPLAPVAAPATEPNAPTPVSVGESPAPAGGPQSPASEGEAPAPAPAPNASLGVSYKPSIFSRIARSLGQ